MFPQYKFKIQKTRMFVHYRHALGHHIKIANRQKIVIQSARIGLVRSIINILAEKPIAKQTSEREIFTGFKKERLVQKREVPPRVRVPS
jgi:hypothetical protein